MRLVRLDPGHARLATLDVETTAFDAAEGELVAVGVGVHDRGDSAAAASWDTFLRDGSGEVALVRRALNRLAAADPDLLLTYNGRAFDVPFVRERLAALDADLSLPARLTDPARHLDLFLARRRRAARTGEPWPTLEDCLAAYGFPDPVTRLDGRRITNERFGEVLGPAVLDAVADGGAPSDDLERAVRHYLRTDLVATLAVYAGDVGWPFEPGALGEDRAFETGAGVWD